MGKHIRSIDRLASIELLTYMVFEHRVRIFKGQVKLGVLKLHSSRDI